ncbi:MULTISPECIES: RNA chaperone ProQ [Corallincola]|uniref:RNA chaperone ProQ n=3 Tax=Corallincola TaxID=1775176 RepID=A0A368NR71_9GAMM|nr:MULTISPECIES: RNA chaperone ProQ [Corallincola]RCU52656.1 RNA chaperone ProQ [Corallincola holothuriorum]TAA48163.1 RNA chaperone ProQ [Corallincola spongiicola]TCI03154.1 RNA chaperone ProQ [Corallincola luteus]
MENQSKAQSIENTLKLLTDTFPSCFTTSGEAKPLKIGIFQDLAERFADNETVSKTQLRVALRRYTSGWRYLECVKEGVERVDLDGASAGVVSLEHAEHAAVQVTESKQRAAERRKQRLAEKSAEKKAKAAKVAKSIPKRGTKPKSSSPKTKAPELKDVSIDALSVDQSVVMTLGTRPVKGIITDIGKDEVQVRLSTGMVLKVQPTHLKVEK